MARAPPYFAVWGKHSGQAYYDPYLAPAPAPALPLPLSSTYGPHTSSHHAVVVHPARILSPASATTPDPTFSLPLPLPLSHRYVQHSHEQPALLPVPLSQP